MQVLAYKPPALGAPWPKDLPRTPISVTVADTYDTGAGQSSVAAELWRDFGINPYAMARRAVAEKPLVMGFPLPQGVKAPGPLMEAVRSDIANAIKQSDGLATLEVSLKDVAESYGLKLELASGAPTVNWDLRQPGVLDVRHSGGPSALHEMVHVVQCVIGGAAALGQAAAEKFQAAHGRPPVSAEEIRPLLAGLTQSEKAEAMKRVVKPMETLAYSRFEETAFHTAGMSGRKSRDYNSYKLRLQEVSEAFAKAYSMAEVPKVDTRLDSKIYGGVAHVARTHGETALMLAGAGAAYYGLTKIAMRIHPALAIPLSAPLGYLLYRSLISG